MSPLMNLPTRYIVTGAIVQVHCGNTIGTAFFVSNNQLLTARHNILDSIVQTDGTINVYIQISNDLIPCDFKVLLNSNGEHLDLVILTIANKYNYCHKSYLSLLGTHFNSDMLLETFGYPKELADCSYSFHLPLGFVDRVPNTEADIILVKKSDVSFFSYDGYSGAPVINQSGKVIAILVIQENHNLRAISVDQVKIFLIQEGINVATNGLEEDYTPTGLGYCFSLWNKYLSKVGSKYSPQLHQPHSELEKRVSLFMNTHAEEEYYNKLNEITDWCKKNPSIGGINCKTTYTQTDILEYLEQVNKSDDAYIGHPSKVEVCEKFRQQLETYKTNIDISNKTFFGVFGCAGVGKSHMCCHLGYKYLNDGNFVYFCLGSDFVPTKEAFSQLLQILGLSLGDIEHISELAEINNKFILFVIDAINEGCGYNYWDAELPKLYESIKKYKRIKFLISGRQQASGIYKILEWHPKIGYNKSLTFNLEGFENMAISLESYCEKFSIPLDEILKLGIDFSNPLMLNIFCQTYQARFFYDEYNRLTIYENYLKNRNNVISGIIDEDPQKQVTLLAVEQLANYSVFQGELKDIKREKAYEICNNISFRREWSKNLLNSLIKENILFEIGEDRRYEHQDIDFEFQNFADVFRAKALLSSSLSDEDIFRSLQHFIDKDEEARNVAINCLVATIGIWYRQSRPDEMLKIISDDILDEALSYGGPLSINIENIWATRFDQLPILLIFRNGAFLSMDFMLKYHNYLKSIPLNQRDLRFIHEVNKPYEFNRQYVITEIRNIIEYNEEFATKKLIFLGWMSLSSHPEFRSILKRLMTKILVNWPSLCLPLSELFYNVNDPYIVENIYCSIYGFLLISRNVDVANALSRHIYDVFYSTTASMPTNLLVRQWTMQILELAYELDHSNSLYNNVIIEKPTSKINPFEWDIDNIDSNEYFGNTPGGKQMSYTLFRDGYVIASDFNRYIIKTNNHTYNPEFIKQDGTSINLHSIERMIAYSIIEIYGWNQQLGEIDTKGNHHGRHNNKVEKIGKKYVWLGYYNIMGLLSDTCKFNCNNIYDGTDNGFIENPRPWMLYEHSRFDPTLLILPPNNLPEPTIQLHNDIGNLENIINNHEAIPETYTSFNDSEGITWILVSGIDSWHMNEENIYSQKHLFIEYESWFLKNYSDNKYSKLKEFCKNNNSDSFPRNSGSQIHFLWNEFPWSERSKRYTYSKWKSIGLDDICLGASFLEQLQEEYSGISNYDDRKYSNVRILTEDIIEFLELYTAERGIIRCKSDNSIASINRDLIDGRTGIYIRKDLIDKYLESNDLMLLIRKENMITGYHSDDITLSWYIYNCHTGIKELA